MEPFRIDDSPVSPAALVDAARAWIPALRRLGVAADAVLAVQNPDPAGWLRVWALAHAAGQPFMPLAPELELEQLGPTAGGIAVLDHGAPNPSGLTLQHTRAPTGAVVSSALPGLIIHTSGSGGRPRGVMHSRGGLAAASRAACERLGFGAEDLWLDCLAPWHIGAVAILQRALHCQARVVLLPGFDAERVWHALQRYPVTHLSLVPAMLAQLLAVAAGQAPPPVLRRVLIGGGPLAEPLYQSASGQRWPLCISYGLTEAGSQVATLCEPGPDWQAGAVGPPLQGVQVAIEDRGEGYGLIRLRGPMLMSGYLNETLRAGDGLSADGWLQTHDLGRLDEAGRLIVLGRDDDVIVSGGVNVHPAPVEQVLCAHPAVNAAAVVGSPDSEYGEIVTAMVAGRVDADELIGWCRERLPSARRPRRVILLQTMPMLASGKIDYRRLREIAASG